MSDRLRQKDKPSMRAEIVFVFPRRSRKDPVDFSSSSTHSLGGDPENSASKSRNRGSFSILPGGAVFLIPCAIIAISGAVSTDTSRQAPKLGIFSPL